MALIFRSESRTFTDVSSVWIVPHRRISVFIRSYSGSSDLGGAGHPVAEGRARQLHPLPGQPALLAIERDMVGILLGDHMSQQSRSGQALLDRLGGLAGRDDLAFAVRAGVRAADVFDHEQGRRLVIELLAALGADLDPALATLRAAALGLGQLVDPRHATEILGQGPAAVGARLLLGRRARLGLGWDRVGRSPRLAAPPARRRRE